MFRFNPRAWRRCGNVRHLFMPRVAGGVTKAASRRCHLAPPAATELLPLPLPPPTAPGLSLCLSFPQRSWEYLDPSPCLLRGGLGASCHQHCGAVTGAGHVPVLAAVALCSSKLALNVPSGARAGLGLFQSPHPGAGTGCARCGVVTEGAKVTRAAPLVSHSLPVQVLLESTGAPARWGDATPSLTKGRRTGLSALPTSDLRVFLPCKTRQVSGLSSSKAEQPLSPRCRCGRAFCSPHVY